MAGLARGMLVASLIVAVLAALCILIERLFPREWEGRPSLFPGFLFLIANPALVALLSYPLSLLWRQVGVPRIISLNDLSPLAAFLVLLVIFDFLRYWEHRVEHAIWWRVHRVHHSQTELHAANSYSHPLIAVTEFLVVLIPLSLVDRSGLPVWINYALSAAMAVQNLWIHSPIKLHLGPLRRLIVDNRYHRIHHSTEPRHFGKNFAITFSIWDQMLGTAYFPDGDEWPETGVAGASPPAGALAWLLAPFMREGRQPVRSFPSSPAGAFPPSPDCPPSGN